MGFTRYGLSGRDPALTRAAFARYENVTGAVVRIPLNRIDDVPRESRFSETPEIDAAAVSAVRFPLPVHVNVTYYRSGREVFFHGGLKGEVEGDCSRCLESFPFVIEKTFDFVLTPDPLPTNKNMELTADEMGLSFYSGEDIDLSPYVREQTLLAPAPAAAVQRELPWPVSRLRCRIEPDCLRVHVAGGPPHGRIP